jgi:lincosamide nucleotidyltransferase A/C/D/E
LIDVISSSCAIVADGADLLRRLVSSGAVDAATVERPPASEPIADIDGERSVNEGPVRAVATVLGAALIGSSLDCPEEDLDCRVDPGACDDDRVNDAAGMNLAEVLAVLDAVRSVGCRYWIEGGWGIDALVGQQTRPHRDVDIDIDGAFESEVLATLRDLGYVIETDWRPNRVELVAPGRGWVDLHPLVIDDDGNARQAALGVGWHEFPRSYFTWGRLGEVPVPCVSREAQRAFRSGYELRHVDLRDLALLDQLGEATH